MPKQYQPKYPGGTWDWRIPGYEQALRDALGPHKALEPQWSLAEMEEKVGIKIVDVSKKFRDDPRCSGSATVIQARMLIEDFVIKCMDAVSTACYEKPWLYKVNFTGPLLAVALHEFQHAKVFSRVLAPALEKYIEDGIFNWAEEERVSKAMTDALEECGAQNTKKATGHLQKAYDEAYFKAPYGTHRVTVPEIGMLQDFIKGWMQDFVNRGAGVISNACEKGGEVNWIAKLFQSLCSPQRACLPHELTAMIKEPPAAPWDFLPQCALECWMSYAPISNPKNKKKEGDGAGPFVSAALAAPAAPAPMPAPAINQQALYAQQMQSLYGQAGLQGLYGQQAQQMTQVGLHQYGQPY